MDTVTPVNLSVVVACLPPLRELGSAPTARFCGHGSPVMCGARLWPLPRQSPTGPVCANCGTSTPPSFRHGESVKTVQARLGHATAAETLDTFPSMAGADDTTRTAVDSVLKIDPAADTARTRVGH